MKEKIHVLVTGVGGAIGMVAIKGLKMGYGNRVRIIGVDCNPLSAGFKFCDKHYLIPPASDSKFLIELFKIASKEKIDVVLPCTDHELLSLSEKKEKFEDIGTHIVVSDKETIMICRDKWKTFQMLNPFVPMPKTISVENLNSEVLKNLKFPLIIKPRSGWGSRQIFVADNESELHVFCAKVKDALIQEFLDGPEYTVDVLCDMNGDVLRAIPRIRIERIAGLTSKGKTVENNYLEKIAEKIAEKITFRGPFNFQAKGYEEPKVFEVNPRLAGSSILSIKAGVNLPYLSVELALNKNVEIPEFRKNVIMIRYFEEVFDGIPPDVNDLRL